MVMMMADFRLVEDKQHYIYVQFYVEKTVRLNAASSFASARKRAHLIALIFETEDKRNLDFNRICHYTPTAIMLARYVTHMNTHSSGGICYASLEVGWY